MHKKTFLIAALALSSGLAFADSDWYGGVSIGESSVDMGDIEGASTATLQRRRVINLSPSSSESDTSFKIFGGYRFNQYFSVESGYADFGSFTARVTGTPAEIKVKADTNAWFVDAVAMFPATESISIFGKGGVAWRTISAKQTLTIAGRSSSDHSNDTMPVPKLGAGVEFQFAKDFAVRGEYEHYFEVGNKDIVGKSELGMWSIGITYSF